jgi:1,4-alpha-glucan branching enzyme
MTFQPDNPDVAAIVRGDHADPFAVLGPHGGGEAEPLSIRTFAPHASRVEVVDAGSGASLAVLERIDRAGFFAGTLPGRKRDLRYRLRVTIGRSVAEIEDPYRFQTVLGELDIYLIGEGRHLELYRKLGAHPLTLDGVDGVGFAVWAPNAKRVSVVGSFNDWDGRRHPMRRRHPTGIWEIFIPGIAPGELYKYELLSADGRLLPLKGDPYAFACERPPATASVVAIPGKAQWSDAAWLAQRSAANGREAAIAIYEVHLGSWRRAEGNRYLTYAELADQLIPYATSLGFTHLELLPVSEHPFDGSWGYQPIGLFAPTSRFGQPQEFAAFVERAHAAGLGVLVDWVPGHFPSDEHGLGLFDGTHLYEHADPRQGFQPEWNTLIYNFGRTEVANFLISNALFWLDVYHVDGLRVDAVASMLYLDYGRKPGEWVPNAEGGRENVAAVAFLQRMNEAAYGNVPGITTVAEESTAWPGVSKPVYLGGLGFGYKWNMGWMHDTLAFASVDPLYRAHHQNQLTFSFTYAYSENFVLPLSHDEVVHEKGSLLGKMPGDRWQRFANVRALFGFMYAQPGKKLMFMGDEFGQDREWNHDRSLDWHLLEDESHRALQQLVGDLNRAYRSETALHELDAEQAGTEWIVSDRERSVVAFARRARAPHDLIVAVANFTPIVRHDYRLGVPEPGDYVELINTDAAAYGGSGVVGGPYRSENDSCHDKPQSIRLTLPPLATVLLRRSPRTN